MSLPDYLAIIPAILSIVAVFVLPILLSIFGSSAKPIPDFSECGDAAGVSLHCTQQSGNRRNAEARNTYANASQTASRISLAPANHMGTQLDELNAKASTGGEPKEI